MRRRTFPRWGSSPFPDPLFQRSNLAGKKEGRTMNPLNQLNKATTVISLIVVLIICYASLQNAQAQECGPRCINLNTAIGVDALFDGTGDLNTATGYFALSHNTTGSNNTATG